MGTIDENGVADVRKPHAGRAGRSGGGAGQLVEGMDTMEEREVELLNKIMRFIVSNKVNAMISFMLNSY